MHGHFLEGCYADPVKMRQSSFLFKCNNSGCPGLVLDHLQPVQDSECLTFNNGNKACVSKYVVCMQEAAVHLDVLPKYDESVEPWRSSTLKMQLMTLLTRWLHSARGGQERFKVALALEVIKLFFVN